MPETFINFALFSLTFQKTGKQPLSEEAAEVKIGCLGGEHFLFIVIFAWQFQFLSFFMYFVKKTKEK